MNSFLIKGILFVFIIIGFAEYAYSEQQAEPLESRVSHLERVMNSQKQLELLFRVKQIKQENQQLRSLLEEQTNEIRLLKQNQQKINTDINKRFGEIEEKHVSTNNSISSENISSQVEIVEKSVSVSPSNSKNEDIQNKVIVKTKTASKTDYQAERKSYQKAYDKLTARQYNQARDSFIEFINQFPDGRYAHIAQYWIAESSYAQHNYEQAIIDYQKLIGQYAVSPKHAEAKLKKSYCYYELGKKDKAREVLNNVLKNYPNSTESGQAKILLEKLK